MIVYLITINNGKQYVGITKHDTPRRRMQDHGRSDQPIGRAIRRHGVRTVVVVWHASNWEDLCKREIELIAQLGTKKPNGYNLTDGGEGSLGFRHSEETLATMSARMMGNTHCSGWDPSVETRAKMKRANSDPTKRAAISVGLKAKWQDPVWAAKMRKTLAANNERKRSAAKAN